MKQSTICICGHALIVHLAGCEVKGCKCKEFKTKEGKSQFDKD